MQGQADTSDTVAMAAMAAIEARNSAVTNYADAVLEMVRDLTTHARLVRANAVDLDDMSSKLLEVIASTNELMLHVDAMRRAEV